MSKDYRPVNSDEEQALDALFYDAATDQSPPSDAFLGRVLADAATIGASYLPEPEAPKPERSPGFWRSFGWPGASFIAASALLGVGFGYAGPDSLLELSSLAGIETVLTTETLDAFDVYQTTDVDFDGI